MRERCCGSRLLEKSRAEVGPSGEIGREKLDCNRPLELHVAREIHCAHSSASKLTLEYVVRCEGFTNFFFGNHRCGRCSHLSR